MPRFAPVRDFSRTRLSRLAVPAVTGAVGISLLFAPMALAQEASPEASPAASPVATESAQTPATITDLYSYDLDGFPTAPVSVRLLRMTLAPGASSPMHTHPGLEFDFVESGTLTVTSDGDAELSTQGADPVSGPLSEQQLEAGDLVVFPAEVGMNLMNTSDEDVVLLSAVFHPINPDVPATKYTDGDPAADAFEGVSYQVLGDGMIESFPSGGAIISLQNLQVPDGTDLPAGEGSTLYSLVNGTLGFSVSGGDVQVSRTASPGLRPNAAPGQEFTLASGDAAFFPEGVAATSREGQEGSVEVLRLSAIPKEGASSGSTPATVEFLQAEAEVTEGEATPAAAVEGYGAGAKVITNTDGVNLRAEPSIEGEVIEQLDAEVELTIVDGPTDADDYTWWQVTIDGTDGPTEGWVAEDFIDLVDQPEATEEATEEAEGTPEAEASPSASPEASPVASDYVSGDIVVTNSDNVRIREEGSLEAESVDAFPIGTELEITGEPVEADDYTWYPVTLVSDDSISGWVASEFIEPAPEDEEE